MASPHAHGSVSIRVTGGAVAQGASTRAGGSPDGARGQPDSRRVRLTTTAIQRGVERRPETVYDRILFPTDGSDGTARAAEHAVRLARETEATLHVLHVVDTTAFPLDAHSLAFVDAAESAGRSSVAAVCKRAETAGVHAVDVVREGTPHREILDYADEADVDLTVLGTHGRTGLSRGVLGSVTERVVRRSDVPVLTVRTLPGPG